jgi:formylmethanofuran dehydrogenase subunit D
MPVAEAKVATVNIINNRKCRVNLGQVSIKEGDKVKIYRLNLGAVPFNHAIKTTSGANNAVIPKTAWDEFVARPAIAALVENNHIQVK